MEIKNTIKFLCDLYNESEDDILSRFGFSSFAGCQNIDKLFKISNANNKQWIIEKALHPNDVFGYATATTYIYVESVDIELQDIQDYEIL